MFRINLLMGATIIGAIFSFVHPAIVAEKKIMDPSETKKQSSLRIITLQIIDYASDLLSVLHSF